jgi:hypothetical protein
VAYDTNGPGGTLYKGSCEVVDPRDRGPTTEIVESDEEPDWDAALPANLCYVAARNYEVEIGARSPHGDALCRRLAIEYLMNEPRMQWPPTYLRGGNPDLAPGRDSVRAIGLHFGNTGLTYGGLPLFGPR